MLHEVPGEAGCPENFDPFACRRRSSMAPRFDVYVAAKPARGMQRRVFTWKHRHQANRQQRVRVCAGKCRLPVRSNVRNACPCRVGMNVAALVQPLPCATNARCSGRREGRNSQSATKKRVSGLRSSNQRTKAPVVSSRVRTRLNQRKSVRGSWGI